MREIFSKRGRITDVQLKYTKDGKFRKFRSVGYQTDEEAAAAIEFLENTCIDTSRISVQTSASLGDDAKPQAWSEYAKDRIQENIIGKREDLPQASTKQIR